VFFDPANKIEVVSTNKMAGYLVWNLVWIQWSYDTYTNDTELTFNMNNGDEIQKFTLSNYAFQDNPRYHHFMGGISQSLNLHNPFKGYIFEVQFMQ
jgi:hypothetical protein